MPLTDEEIEWWKGRWWAEEEYSRTYRDRISVDEVDKSMRHLARVFNAPWARRVGIHPVHWALLGRGLLQFHFMVSMGRELALLNGSIRFRELTESLRSPTEFDSASVELAIAATLRAHCYEIEFHPPLPSGKSADLLATRGSEKVYFEIKKLRESQVQIAIDHFSRELMRLLLAATDDHAGPLSGFRFDVRTGFELIEALRICWSDTQTVLNLAERAVIEAGHRVAAGVLSFDIFPIGHFSFFRGDLQGSGISAERISTEEELQRVLRKRLPEAINQLHEQHPGIVVFHASGALDSGVAKPVIGELLRRPDSSAAHVSAIFFLPVIYPLPGPWSLFRAFSVKNDTASTPPDQLVAFDILSRELLQDLDAPTKDK